MPPRPSLPAPRPSVLLQFLCALCPSTPPPPPSPTSSLSHCLLCVSVHLSASCVSPSTFFCLCVPLSASPWLSLLLARSLSPSVSGDLGLSLSGLQPWAPVCVSLPLPPALPPHPARVPPVGPRPWNRGFSLRVSGQLLWGCVRWRRWRISLNLRAIPAPIPLSPSSPSVSRPLSLFYFCLRGCVFPCGPSPLPPAPLPSRPAGLLPDPSCPLSIHHLPGSFPPPPGRKLQGEGRGRERGGAGRRKSKSLGRPRGQSPPLLSHSPRHGSPAQSLTQSSGASRLRRGCQEPALPVP